jgi:CxxC motif-containing protein (DUF1111 family)
VSDERLVRWFSEEVMRVPGPVPRWKFFPASVFPVMAMALLAVSACRPEPDEWPPPDWREFELAGPLPGLTAEERARWEVGLHWFTHIFTPEEGLGPAWNENSCNACHSDPTIGGGMDEPDYHATRQAPDGSCDFLFEDGGGNLRRQLSPKMKAILGVEWEPRPAKADQLGLYMPPPLFGTGMIASIPEAAILAGEDPHDSTGNGISGRAARYPDGTVARFLTKANAATLLEIADRGLWRQMGVTTPYNPEEHPVMGRPVPPEADPVPDPEIGADVVHALVDYLLFLAPAPHAVPPTPEGRARVTRGRQLFDETGCADCHTPVLYTGPSETEALDRKPVYLFSDLLLHDMGPDLASNCGKDASASEIRTPPLMGIRYKLGWLHDGRAPSLRQAIGWHGGEGAMARTRFEALPPLDQEAILHFLRTL